jgi:hypothetical protein
MTLFKKRAEARERQERETRDAVCGVAEQVNREWSELRARRESGLVTKEVYLQEKERIFRPRQVGRMEIKVDPPVEPFDFS